MQPKARAIAVSAAIAVAATCAVVAAYAGSVTAGVLTINFSVLAFVLSKIEIEWE